MSKDSILGANKIVAFVHITDWARARAFYEDVLGLRLVEEEKPFALVFDANGIMLASDPGGEHNLRLARCWLGVDPSSALLSNSPRPGLSSCAIRTQRQRPAGHLDLAQRRPHCLVSRSRRQCASLTQF